MNGLKGSQEVRKLKGFDECYVLQSWFCKVYFSIFLINTVFTAVYHFFPFLSYLQFSLFRSTTRQILKVPLAFQGSYPSGKT